MNEVKFGFVERTEDWARYRCPCGYVMESTPDIVICEEGRFYLQCPSCDLIEGPRMLSDETEIEEQ